MRSTMPLVAGLTALASFSSAQKTHGVGDHCSLVHLCPGHIDSPPFCSGGTCGGDGAPCNTGADCVNDCVNTAATSPITGLCSNERVCGTANTYCQSSEAVEADTTSSLVRRKAVEGPKRIAKW